jgi:hypothetical protein
MLGLWGTTRRFFTMDTFLTLVIALGGIATGIGAIWAALAARRQAQLTEQSLAEQREAFQEQTEISRRQAQLTERSLTEQSERARLNMAVDLIFRYAGRFDSQSFLSSRRAAASYLLDNVFVDDDMVEVSGLNRAGWDVCGFFEELAYLQRIEALPVEALWNSFGSVTRAYWPLCKPAIEKLRQEWKSPSLYEEFEHLSRVVAELESKRGTEPPTKEYLRQVMEREAVLGEEPSGTE